MTAEQPALFDELSGSIDRGEAPFLTVLVHFAIPDDREAFQQAIGQRIPTTKAMWYPKAPEAKFGTLPPEIGVGALGRARIVDDGDGLLGHDDAFHRIRQLWQWMPEFVQEDLEAFDTIAVSFATEIDVDAFERIVGQKVQRGSSRTAAVWYPKMGIGGYSDKRYVGDPPLTPRYPLYIVSKGRATTQMTSRALTAMNVPHHVVVEEDQRAEYEANAHELATFVTLDPEYKRTYDRLTPDHPESPGSGAARNFAWDHSISTYGAKRHWVMDDNILQFNRFNRNLKTPVADGTIFAVMETYVERFVNVAMAGPNYFMFAVRKSNEAPPFYLNTRIYSCNLIRNDLPFRWRGRYNEDTILSLDLLKAGWATILFNAFLQYKATTQTMKGGNTTELYGSGTLAKSQMLVDAHPDVARLAKRFHDAQGNKRDHHVVDYRGFRQQLELHPDLEVPEGVNNYGMHLERIDPQTKRWVRMHDGPWYPWEDGR